MTVDGKARIEWEARAQWKEKPLEGAVDKGHSVGGLMRTPLFRCPGLATRTGGLLPSRLAGRMRRSARLLLIGHVTGRSGVAGLDPFVRIAVHLLVGLASLEPSPPWFAHWARCFATVARVLDRKPQRGFHT